MDKRLALLASMVRKGSLVADVGCDHGILITELMKENIIRGGTALDINPLPLKKARMRIKAMGMEKDISCLLSDGLLQVEENRADDIVIAGMGGELIFKIISDCLWKHNKDKRFILNPMTKAAFLRISMAENGFSLLEERAAQVNRKHYSVMKYAYTGKKEKYSQMDVFAHIGLLADNLDEDARGYIEGQAAMAEKKAQGLYNVNTKEAQEHFALAEALREVLR